MTHKQLTPLSPGMKIAAQIPPEPSQDDLDFLNQMGVETLPIREIWQGHKKTASSKAHRALHVPLLVAPRHVTESRLEEVAPGE